MTIKEIAEITGAGIRTIKRRLDDYPELIREKGKEINIPENIGIEIIKSLPKKNFVNIGQTAQGPMTNGTTNDIMQICDRK